MARAERRKRRAGTRAKLAIAIVGTGRAGTTMARALGGLVGVSVTLHGRRPARVRTAARRVRVGAGRAEHLARADLVLLAVPDDRIEAVAADLAHRAHLAPRAVVLHLAGARGSDALRSLRGRVRGVGVMHPLQSLADPARGARSLRGALFAVAGDPPAVRAGGRLARLLGGKAARVPEAGRALYHAAASMTSGGVTALLALAEEAMVEAGLSRASARRGLLALLGGTAANVAALGPRRALTGPVARGDRGTIHRHRRALGAVGPAAVDLYDALGRAVRHALRSGTSG